MPVRFRFCGDAEVPDWILASIHDISTEKTGELRRVVRNVVKAILSENEKDVIEKDKRIDLPVESIAEEGRVAAINYILRNAISYEVTEATLSNELQQIGFPHEHAVCFCQVYTQHIAELKSKAEKQSLRCSIPKSIICQTKDEDDDGNGGVNLDLNVWQAKSRCVDSYKFALTKEQAELLVDDLSAILERIEIIL